MSVLKSVAAYGGFIDKEKTKFGIEEGFDFTVTLDEKEAADFSAKPSEYGSELTVRISCMGVIEDAVCSHNTDDPDLNIRDYVDEEHEDAVTELVNDMGLGDIATSITRYDMVPMLCELSEKQPDDDIMVMYGEDYDKYLEGYNGYILNVFSQGSLMICKHGKFEGNTAGKWGPYVTKTMTADQIKTAKELAHKYNIMDEYANEPDESLKDKLYSVSDEGRAEGEAAVRDMSENPVLPIYMNISKEDIKEPSTGVLPKIRVRLRDAISGKNSHK